MKVKQSIPEHLRYTVQNFNDEFPTDDACLEYIKEQRWPSGVTQCSKCGVERKHYRVSGRTAYACDHCGKHIYPLAGTIFHKSSTSLRLWFYAAYLIGSTRCGISAKQVQRETGVTYKTAWRIFHQVRKLMADSDLQVEGATVEMDETYFGGKRKNKRGRPGLGDKKKVPIIGIAERGGRVIAVKTEQVKGSVVLKLAKERILPKSTIFTDEYKIYDGLTAMPNKQFTHKRIHHASGVYVLGDVHTNTIEGFWSLVKRGIGGVYHSVSEKYLQSYLDEYTFRYNRRHEGNQQFRMILERVSQMAS